jgi:hypothetical protein
MYKMIGILAAVAALFASAFGLLLPLALLNRLVLLSVALYLGTLSYRAFSDPDTWPTLKALSRPDSPKRTLKELILKNGLVWGASFYLSSWAIGILFNQYMKVEGALLICVPILAIGVLIHASWISLKLRRQRARQGDERARLHF